MNKKITIAFTVMVCVLFSNAQDKMYIMKNNGIQAEYDISQEVDAFGFHDETNTLQDSLYIMKSGAISGRYDINTQLDSIIFYNPGTGVGDINNDGELNILILGTSQSLKPNTEAFDPSNVAIELQKILSQDTSLSATPYVEAEDIYKVNTLTTAIGGTAVSGDATYFCHSLMQHFYWPEGKTERMDNLLGNGIKDWDYVIICADPYIVSTLPEFYALGVNTIATKVYEGGAKPLLMMMWPKETTSLKGIAHFEEFTYRSSEGADVPLETVPAGLAWNALDAGKKDTSVAHPSTNGAYVAAASIYSQIFYKSAADSDYMYDDAIASTVLAEVNSAAVDTHFTGDRTYITPFSECNVSDLNIVGHHYGTSTENGILAGLQWVFGKSPRGFNKIGGDSRITTSISAKFNYGRSNVYFEPEKRYNVAPSQFDFSFGLPMQDHSNTGNITMHYGLDKRSSIYRNAENDNGVDIKTATYMIEQSEVPYARAIPVRALMLILKEANIITSTYSDSWHLNKDLDKAIAGYMLTMLTGNCDLGAEPADKTSAAWKSWAAHKIGYETAWRLMYLKQAPTCTN